MAGSFPLVVWRTRVMIVSVFGGDEEVLGASHYMIVCIARQYVRSKTCRRRLGARRTRLKPLSYRDSSAYV